MDTYIFKGRSAFKHISFFSIFLQNIHWRIMMDILWELKQNNFVKWFIFFSYGYCCRKWNQWDRFKSWISLLVFSFALISERNLDSSFLYLAKCKIVGQTKLSNLLGGKTGLMTKKLNWVDVANVPHKLLVLYCNLLIHAEIYIYMLDTYWRNESIRRKHDNDKDAGIKTHAGRKMQEDFFNNILPLTLFVRFERVVQGLHVRGSWRSNIAAISWPHCYDPHVVSFSFFSAAQPGA